MARYLQMSRADQTTNIKKDEQMTGQSMLTFCKIAIERLEWIDENGGYLSPQQVEAIYSWREEVNELALIAIFETRQRVTAKQEKHIEKIIETLDELVTNINESNT